MNHSEFIVKFQWALNIYCEFHLNTFFHGFYLFNDSSVMFYFGENFAHKRITIAHINMVLNHPNTIGRVRKNELEIIKWWNDECVNRDNGISIK